MENLMKNIVTMITCIFNMQVDTSFTLWQGVREIKISVTHTFGSKVLAIAHVEDVLSGNTRHVDGVIGHWDDMFWYQNGNVYDFVRKVIKAVKEV